MVLGRVAVRTVVGVHYCGFSWPEPSSCASVQQFDSRRHARGDGRRGGERVCGVERRGLTLVAAAALRANSFVDL